MSHLAGASVGMIGALGALPRRIAAREVAARGGELHRGTTRRTTVVVFGRSLLARLGETEIEAQVAAACGPGRSLRSENGFMRLLAGNAPAEGMTRVAVLEQSGLAPLDLDHLALFDAFENDVEPFSFRDLILAGKYAGLVAGGAGWGAIARSVGRFGPAVSLTAKSLQVGGGQVGGGKAIYARHDETLAELDGQLLLELGAAEDPDDAFAAAEAAEDAGDAISAAALYARCLAIDPGDAVAAFNRANCLAASDRGREAEHELARALRLDPGFVEAWFNLAGLRARPRPRRRGPRASSTSDRARSDLFRCGVQPCVPRVRGGRSLRRRGAGGRAISSSIPIPTGAGRPPGGCGLSPFRRGHRPAEMDGFLIDGPGTATTTLLLAHGAGAPMDSPATRRVRRGIRRDGPAGRPVRVRLHGRAAERVAQATAPGRAADPGISAPPSPGWPVPAAW